jgi:hypothetical protein
MEEIQKVEIFYNTKYLEYSQELDILKETFMKKKNKHHKTDRKVKKIESLENMAAQQTNNGFIITNNFDGVLLP